jgi:hypothetical protein
MCRRSCRRRCSYPRLTTTSSQCVASRRMAVVIRPPRGPVNSLAMGVIPHRIQATGHQWANLRDDRTGTAALTLGALVDQPTRRGRGLPTHLPIPRSTIDVLCADSGDFADPGSRARGEPDHVTPAHVIVGRPGYQRISQFVQGIQVPQRKRPGVVQLILSLLVRLLPPGETNRIDVNEPITHGLFQDTHQGHQTVLRTPNKSGGLDLVRGRCRARGRRVAGRGQPRNRTR